MGRRRNRPEERREGSRVTESLGQGGGRVLATSLLKCRGEGRRGRRQQDGGSWLAAVAPGEVLPRTKRTRRLREGASRLPPTRPLLGPVRTRPVCPAPSGRLRPRVPSTLRSAPRSQTLQPPSPGGRRHRHPHCGKRAAGSGEAAWRAQRRPRSRPGPPRATAALLRRRAARVVSWLGDVADAAERVPEAVIPGGSRVRRDRGSPAGSRTCALNLPVEFQDGAERDEPAQARGEAHLFALFRLPARRGLPGAGQDPPVAPSRPRLPRASADSARSVSPSLLHLIRTAYSAIPSSGKECLKKKKKKKWHASNGRRFKH